MIFNIPPAQLTALPLVAPTAAARAPSNERTKLSESKSDGNSKFGTLTTIVIVSGIAFCVIVLLGTATLLLREESELVTEARAEIFAPAAASAHSAELILEKMLKTEDADSFHDGAVKLNNTAAVLRTAAARIVGLRRNRSKSL